MVSDIASRGLDIDELSCVVNFDIPDIPDTYVHRIGRTGRAISFCTPEEKVNIKRIERLLPKPIPVIGAPVLPENVTLKTVQTPLIPAPASPRPRFNRFHRKKSLKPASKNKPVK